MFEGNFVFSKNNKETYLSIVDEKIASIWKTPVYKKVYAKPVEVEEGTVKFYMIPSWYDMLSSILIGNERRPEDISLSTVIEDLKKLDYLDEFFLSKYSEAFQGLLDSGFEIHVF